MSSWFKQLMKPNQPVVHPPWETDQYVTYIMERNDGSWLAIILTLVGKTKDGDWVICADFKDEVADTRAFIAFGPSDRRLDNVKLGRTEVLRGTLREFDSNDVKSWNHPDRNLPLALNLLFVQGYESTAKALQGKPHAVDYACGIKEAYSIVAQAPGYMKHIDLNPRVMLTGVACQSVNGDTNPITMTSFGINNLSGKLATTYNDYIDFSHLTRIEHDGFSLTYPATWLLHQREDKSVPDSQSEHMAMVGGNTCAAAMSVSIYAGKPTFLKKKKEEFIPRFTNEVRTPQMTAIPRKNDTLKLEGGAQTFVTDTFFPGADGVARDALFEANGRLVMVSINGSVAKQNPRRKESLDEMERVFREIVASFRLT